jgi:hypothetical protein
VLSQVSKSRPFGWLMAALGYPLFELNILPDLVTSLNFVPGEFILYAAEYGIVK